MPNKNFRQRLWQVVIYLLKKIDSYLENCGRALQQEWKERDDFYKKHGFDPCDKIDQGHF